MKELLLSQRSVLTWDAQLLCTNKQPNTYFCPCHQSTFDVTRAAKVIFGPAARPLPQLAITVDSEGYLVAKQPFTEAVGPSFLGEEIMSAREK